MVNPGQMKRSEVCCSLLLLALFGLANCGPSAPDSPLTAEMPLHLVVYTVSIRIGLFFS